MRFLRFVTGTDTSISKSLTDAGEISQVEAGSIGERGGLEVSTLRMLAGTTLSRR